MIGNKCSIVDIKKRNVYDQRMAKHAIVPLKSSVTVLANQIKQTIKRTKKVKKKIIAITHLFLPLSMTRCMMLFS